MDKTLKMLGVALLSVLVLAGCSKLGIDYELSSGQHFTDINGAYSNKDAAGYHGYMYYFSYSPLLSTQPWNTSTLHSPAPLNGGNDATQCYYRNENGSVMLNFYCGGSVTTPAQPPEGDYQVHVGAKTYSFSGVHSRLVASNLDNVFLPEIRLTMDGSGKISQIQWRWWKRQSGSWVTPSSSDLSAQLANVEYEIGQSGWAGPRVLGNMPLTATGSITASSQSFTPGAVRISYTDKQGYHYGIEWR